MLKINSFIRFTFGLVLGFCFTASFAGDLPSALTDAIKNGNAVELAKYFNTNIELSIPGQADIYSSQQAELIVKSFFGKHAPIGFMILHKGGNEGSQYIIGKLTTSHGAFRVTLLVKYRDNRPFIHQLRFDEDSSE
jgi:hypothetical protein